MIPTLAQAYESFDRDDSYFNAAQSAGEYTYRYILQHKGVGICRGIAHNIYMLSNLLKMTKDLRYKYYIYETIKYMFDLSPPQSDVTQINEYACPSSSAFIDS